MTVSHDILLSAMTASNEPVNTIRQMKTAIDMTKTSKSNPMAFLHNISLMKILTLSIDDHLLQQKVLMWPHTITEI